MNLFGNILWVLFGGLFLAFEYLIASIILMITIVGIPFGIQTLKMAGLSLWPFGKETQVKENTSGCLSTLMNIVWILIGGIWISLSHLFIGIIFALTIIGLPFANQHFKLGLLALTPFGREVIKKSTKRN